jgi:hypothetical protein
MMVRYIRCDLRGDGRNSEGKDEQYNITRINYQFNRIKTGQFILITPPTNLLA